VRIESIFHPSDFSEASEVAFAHALRMALATRSRLHLMHVSADAGTAWEDFPGVRATLARWKLIAKDAPRSAVAGLGIDVSKVMAAGADPAAACLAFLEEHPADLIVLAVHQDGGRMRWLDRSVGKRIARRSGETTLFLPHGARGFVSREDGSVSLGSILIPIAAKPRPQPGIEAAVRLIENLDLPEGKVTLLHAGPAGDMPAVDVPRDARWTWERVTREGEPVAVILETAAASSADLIVMTTDGPEGFLDGLRGTTSERVLRRAGCPVASLPVGSLLG
jgi:nucleotide-binding universal stress UspA family protein